MSDKLKPCPFCGGEAVISGCDGGDWIVICNVCDASIGDKGTEREAIEEWNCRIEPTFTPDQLKEIRLMFDIGVRKLPDSHWVEIWQSIVDKCDAALKGTGNE